MNVLSRNRLKEIASLSRRKGREKHGLYVAEGMRLVKSAVACDAPVVELLLGSPARIEPELLQTAQRKRIRTYTVPPEDFERLSDVDASQGIMAVLKMELTDAADLVQLSRIVMLDGVQDPGNAGTIIRAAAWFGIEAVVALPGTVDLFNPKVVRGSMGGFWDLRISVTADGRDLVQSLMDAGFTCVAAHVKGTPVQKWQPEGRVALLLGSEAHGISAEYEEFIRDCVAVPRAHGAHGSKTGVESLNVAMAASIILQKWEELRRH